MLKDFQKKILFCLSLKRWGITNFLYREKGLTKNLQEKNMDQPTIRGLKKNKEMNYISTNKWEN